jgi:transcriptional regulator with XRE-family HTH domain
MDVAPMALLMAHQLRAARSMLRWEQEQLAATAGVAIGTVKRIEAMEGTIRAHLETVQKLQRALETAGVEFKPDGSVRLCEQRTAASEAS